MEPARRLLWIRRLAVTLVVMTFALMVLGSWVKATGSGLACPDWPKCYGEWLPPFPSAESGGTDPDGFDHADRYSQAQVLYEWAHRLLASLVGIPFVALAVLAWRDRRLHDGLRWSPVAAGGVLVVQVLLGGITVVGQNAAPLTTAHLATATVFFFLVTLTAAFAFLRPHRPEVAEALRPARAVYPGEVPGDE